MRWKLLGVALVTFGFLAAALRGADLHAVLDACRSLPLWRIGVVIVLHFVVLGARTQRFRHLLPSRPPMGSLLAVMSASFLAINVVPLRMGEIVRPYLLSQRGVPFADAALAVVIERLLDLVALLGLVLIASWWIDGAGWHGREVTVLGTDVVVLGRAAILGSAILVIAALVVARVIARRARSGRLAQLDRAFETLAQRSRADIAIVLVCTLASWAGSTLACGVAMGGFEVLDASPSTVLVDWAATVSAVVLVPTPGFLGAFEAGAVGALVLLGRDADVARAFALALHAMQLGATLVAGTIGFATLGVSLPSVIRASRAP